MGGEGVAGKVHRCDGLDEGCLDVGQNRVDARECSWIFVDGFDADRGLCDWLQRVTVKPTRVQAPGGSSSLFCRQDKQKFGGIL